MIMSHTYETSRFYANVLFFFLFFFLVFVRLDAQSNACPGPPQDCDGKGTWSLETCRCDCQEGWKGAGCGLCDADESCQLTTTSDDASVCITTLEYEDNQSTKNYSCSMDDPTVNDLLADDIRLHCDVVERKCQVELAFALEADRNIVCEARECSFQAGKKDVTCSSSSCSCPNGCPEGFESLILDISGSVDLVCGTGNSCTLDMADLPLEFAGQCVVGTCQLADSTGGLLGGEEEDSSTSNTVVIAVVCGVLGGLVVLLAVYLIYSNRRENVVRKEIHRLEDALGMERDTYLPDMSASLFEFSNITCTITKGTGSSFKERLKNVLATPRDSQKTPRKPTDESPRSDQDASIDVVHGTYDDQGQRIILKEANGCVSSGSMIAFMGPSGSGKTTLLSVLVGADVGSQIRVTGKVTLDGEDVSRSGGVNFSRFRRITGFVHQDDMLLSTLTVYESILYSAMLRLPFYWTKAKKCARANEVIQELSLEHVRDSTIGGKLRKRGISGGERRRVSIGMELTTNPRILALDEPTSGLDSFSAYTVMHALHKLTKQGGKMVILSLHQPSSEVFQELDQVHFLAKGNTVYSGPAKSVYSFVHQSGLPCPPGHNIADWMLSLISHREPLNNLLKSWEENKSTYFAVQDAAQLSNEEVSIPPSAEETVGQPLASCPSGDDSDSDDGLSASTRKYVACLSPSTRKKLMKGVLLQPPLHELRVLFWRAFVVMLRNPALMLTHFAVSILLAILCGLTFEGLEPNLQGFQNRGGFFFFALSFFAFASLTSIDVFMAEREVFFRERGSKYYRTSTYYFSKVLLDALFLRIIPVCMFGLVTYWWVGLQEESSKIGIFFATMMLFNVTVDGLAMCISIASSTAGIATLANTVILLLMVLFGGLYVNVDTVTDALAWLKYVSLFHYAYEVLLSNEMQGLLVTFNVPGFPPVPNVRGQVYLETLNMSHSHIGIDLAALGGFCLGFYLLGYLLLVPGRKFVEVFSKLLGKCRIPQKKSGEGTRTTRSFLFS